MNPLCFCRRWYRCFSCVLAAQAFRDAYRPGIAPKKKVATDA